MYPLTFAIDLSLLLESRIKIIDYLMRNFESLTNVLSFGTLTETYGLESPHLEWLWQKEDIDALIATHPIAQKRRSWLPFGRLTKFMGYLNHISGGSYKASKLPRCEMALTRRQMGLKPTPIKLLATSRKK